MIARIVRTLREYVRAPAARSADELGDAIEQEIAFHLAQRQEEYAARGLTAEEARRATVARFGNPARVAAECHAAAVGGLAVWHRAHLAMTALLAVAVAMLWFSSRSADDGPQRFLSQLPPGVASLLDNDWTGDIQGQVRDESGQAIANAHVLAVVKTWPDESYFQRAYAAVTDDRGQFLIENVHPVNARYAVQIAVIAEHRVLQSTYTLRPGGEFDPVRFELPPSVDFALQVESSRGDSLAGVEILPHGRLAADGSEHHVYFDSAQPLIRRTDEQGRVRLPYFQPGETATVLLRTQNGEWQPRDIVVPRSGDVARIRASLDELNHPSRES